MSVIVSEAPLSTASRNQVLPKDLSTVSVEELLVLCDGMYRCLDRERPCDHDYASYLDVMDELDRRGSDQPAS